MWASLLHCLQVDGVSCDHNASDQIQNEAKKWTTVVARETSRLQAAQKGLESMQEQSVNGEVNISVVNK